MSSRRSRVAQERPALEEGFARRLHHNSLVQQGVAAQKTGTGSRRLRARRLPSDAWGQFRVQRYLLFHPGKWARRLPNRSSPGIAGDGASFGLGLFNMTPRARRR
jgi:hypothetical protein